MNNFTRENDEIMTFPDEQEKVDHGNQTDFLEPVFEEVTQENISINTSYDSTLNPN